MKMNEMNNIYVSLFTSMGVPEIFQGVGQSRHFAYPFQVADDAVHMDTNKTFTISTLQRKCPVLR